MRMVVVCRLGRIEYAPAWELQKRIQARLIEAKRKEPREEVPHVLLLVEHPPVFTLGKSGNDSNLLLSEDALAARGATFHRIDRGGDITFHGPGQIVGYPILDLDHFFTDIHRYLRELEEAVILTCSSYGLEAGRIPGRTGVWIGPDDRGPERKICAMGIRSSRWVTMHGLALNVNTDLSYFSYINPCGITDRGVTSLAREVGREIDVDDVQAEFIRHFTSRFDTDIQMLEKRQVFDFLEHYLSEDLTGVLSPRSQPV